MVPRERADSGAWPRFRLAGAAQRKSEFRPWLAPCHRRVRWPRQRSRRHPQRHSSQRRPARFAPPRASTSCSPRRIGDATPLPSLVAGLRTADQRVPRIGLLDDVCLARFLEFPGDRPCLRNSILRSRSTAFSKAGQPHASERAGSCARATPRRDTQRLRLRSGRRIEEYTNSIREVEGRLARLQANEGAGPNAAIRSQRPANGLPAQLNVHPADVRHHRAGLSDRPHAYRHVAADEQSLRAVYPFLGLRDVHHGLSHNCQGRNSPRSAASGWSNSPICSAGWRPRKKATAPSSTIGASCRPNEQWTVHNTEKVPLLVAGGLGGGFQTGRTLDFERSRNRKFSSLLMTLADRMGLRLDRFGDSTEQLDI